MWELYVTFCEKHTRKATAGGQAAMLAACNALVLACERAYSSQMASPSLFSTWINTLLGLGRAEDALQAAAQATAFCPQSSFLWLLRIKLHVRFHSLPSSLSPQDNNDERSEPPAAKKRKKQEYIKSADEIFAQALEVVPVEDSLGLWCTMLELAVARRSPFEHILQYFKVKLTRAFLKRHSVTIPHNFVLLLYILCCILV